MGDQLLKLSANDGEDFDWFGVSVDASETIAMVGADHKNENSNNDGVVYLMDITTGNTLRKLTPSDAAADDQFGYELVPADVELAYSKPDPNLKKRVV